MFISSAQSLDMLQHYAPRAWCKRLLLWQIFDGGLHAFFRHGLVIEKSSALKFLVESQGEDGQFSLSRVEEFFGKELADALRAAGVPETPTNLREYTGLGFRIEVGRQEWDDEPTAIPIGAFVYADVLDFEAGWMKAEDFSPQHDESLFRDYDEFQMQFDDSTIDVEASGLCFSHSAIEMMAPGSPPIPATRFDEASAVGQRPRGGPGRARKWDWDGALAHVVSIANTPDGLPDGHGAQAAVERMISDWFMHSQNGSPQESEIRKRASQIMAACRAGRK